MSDKPQHPAQSDEPDDVADFLDLSIRLTGVANLDRDLARQYLVRARSQPFGQDLESLLAEYRSIRVASPDIDSAIRSQILGAPALSDVARQVTLVWYTSAFELGDRLEFGTPSQYFSALMWPAIGAHPPALSGGYVGHWKYPPES